MKLLCYGYSDDVAIIEIYRNDGSGTRSYYSDCGCYNRPCYAEVTNGTEGIILAFNYVGTWAVGIAQLGEGFPIPEWAQHPYIQRKEEGDYTVTFILEDVPDDVKIKWFYFHGGRREEVDE